MNGMPSLPPRADVVVVGAGLSGLSCSVLLAQAGLDVVVLEADDAVGGRVRTDRVDGFLLDRGFQVLNTAYPEAQRTLDLDALDPQAFNRETLVHVDGHRLRLGDPRRDPLAVPRTLAAPIGSLTDKAALGAYLARVAGSPVSRLLAQPEVSARQAWHDHKISETTIEQVLRPFVSGVILENEMTTSRRFVDLMMRMFVRGETVVPAGGMQQIATQLATRLPDDRVHLQTAARRVGVDAVDTDARSISCAAVVVATDATAAHTLLGGIAPPEWKGVTTMYHAADEPPLAEPTLLLDVEASPVNNTIVMSAAAPTYSSDGRALVATSVVHGAQNAPTGEADVRARLSTLYGTNTSQWEHIASYDVAHALPAMTAPHTFGKPVRHHGVYLCGDHRTTSSIQGALFSGRRAAEAVLSDLHLEDQSSGSQGNPR